jgi:hypothetical protein
MEAAIWQMGRTPILPTPSKSFGTQDPSGGRVAFFWLLFFAQTKKSNWHVGARTNIQITSLSESFLSTTKNVHMLLALRSIS